MNNSLISDDDLPTVIENLKAMKTVDVAMIYRVSEFNLYLNSPMMLTITELVRRTTVPEEIVLTLEKALKTLRDEVYAAEAYDQSEQYEEIDAAEEWLKGMK